MAKIDKNDNNYIYYWVGKNIRKQKIVFTFNEKVD